MRASPSAAPAESRTTCADSLGLAALGLDAQLRISRLLVRVGDAGELRDLAGEAPSRRAPSGRGARTPRASRDVHLDERRVLLDERASAAAASPRTARSRRRSPRRRRGRAARRPSRSAAMFVSRSSFEKPRPFERCVRTTSPSRWSTSMAALLRARPRRRSPIVDLPGTGEPGEPDDETGQVRSSFTSSVATVWMPHSTLSVPAQRPSRPSPGCVAVRVSRSTRSPGRAAGCTGGRVRGCRPSSARRLQSASGFAFQSSCCSSHPTFGAFARVGDWSRRTPVIQASRSPSARTERLDLRDREAEVGVASPRRSRRARQRARSGDGPSKTSIVVPYRCSTSRQCAYVSGKK